MNTVLLNREGGFATPAENFAGLLIDFDHFPLDVEKRSEAAGWITALECREPLKLETGSSGQEGERSTLNAQPATFKESGGPRRRGRWRWQG